jgi:deoxycytidine triphosphate deaminase
MSIKSDSEIHEWAATGGITPYTTENINPASIDLRLGNRLSRPRWYWRYPIIRFFAWHLLGHPDPRRDNYLYWSEAQSFERFTLWPGEFVLCHSLEATQIPPNMAAMLLSKSSTGRIGLEHLHAGFGDPGFGYGNPSEWTWELVNLAPWPIELIAGQRLTQLVLMEMSTVPKRDYSKTGRYNGQTGPTAARVKAGRNSGEAG